MHFIRNINPIIPQDHRRATLSEKKCKKNVPLWARQLVTVAEPLMGHLCTLFRPKSCI